MNKKSKFQKLGGLLSNFEGPKKYQNFDQARKNKYSDDIFDFLGLIEKWQEIVGEKLSKVTIPIKNQRGTLVILSNHPQYSQQLSFMQNVVIEKIVKIFPNLKGKIKDLKFQVNESFFKEKMNQYAKLIKKPDLEVKQVFHPHSPEFKRLKKMAEDKFSDISDPEVKDSLISIFIQFNSNKKS